MLTTTYDVTQWHEGDAHEDIGLVLNSILADIRRRQPRPGTADGGRPGAVIHVPVGDYHLRTPVCIDVSYVRIVGEGHGFTSSSIRYNLTERQVGDLHEVWPGGSRILVELDGGAAFTIARDGSPRLSSIEISRLCIDGLHFTGESHDGNPENSYRNGITGIETRSPTDSLRISEMGLVYLEHGLVIRQADALSIHDNFIAECGSCVELLDWGQASKVTDNLLGAGPWGHTIYAENHGGLLVTANNVFPRGSSSVYCAGVTRSNISANRFHTFYPGAVILDQRCAENLLSSNHILRDEEPWAPFHGVTNGRGDADGVVRIDGRDNSVIANHVSLVLEAVDGPAPVAFRVVGGSGHYLATNHVVAHRGVAQASESCFEAQVGALLADAGGGRAPVIAVEVDDEASACTVLDCGRASELRVDGERHAVRPVPSAALPR